MNDFFNQIKCDTPQELARQVKFSEEEFPVLGDDCAALGPQGNRPFCYQICVSRCAQMVYRWHFGFRAAVPLEKILKKGVDMALTYFGLVRDDLAKMTAQTDWREQAAWFEPYSESLLLATLAGCTRERTQLSDLLHPALSVERMALPHTEAALGDVLLCVAASFQSSAMDTAPILERLQKCRKQRPKLLFKAWQALESGDRTKFASALADATANFAKTTADDDSHHTAVALQESILAAIAYERGWTDLSFELPIAARLVTHQSLELK